ncbi:hypothetical protein APU01nite_13700 [Alkalibacterium putridalgicola]|uniref:Uncharacterized protein n=1 Tax=Alkalibacterium putridalgicola TaxID=426703 RepID=A0ABQ0UXR0_9LACT|nr:hypothetical protein APU01nite_13700 [Alkalibacterium putridalgicola]
MSKTATATGIKKNQIAKRLLSLTISIPHYFLLDYDEDNIISLYLFTPIVNRFELEIDKYSFTNNSAFTYSRWIKNREDTNFTVFY